jgi:hypothetical protein
LETPSVADAFMVVLALEAFVEAILTELTRTLAGVLRMLGGRVDICMAVFGWDIQVGLGPFLGECANWLGPCTRH